MESSFPQSIFSKFSGINNNESSRQTHTNDNNIDSNVNRIAKNIACAVIKSSEIRDDNVKNKLPSIPTDILLYAFIIIAKVALFAAYKKAEENGLDIINL